MGKRTLKNLDIFGRPALLTFNGHGSYHKTACGGVATILFFLFSFIFILICLSSSAKVESSGEEVRLNEELEDEFTVMYTQQKYFRTVPDPRLLLGNSTNATGDANATANATSDGNATSDTNGSTAAESFSDEGSLSNEVLPSNESMSSNGSLANGTFANETDSNSTNAIDISAREIHQKQQLGLMIKVIDQSQGDSTVQDWIAQDSSEVTLPYDDEMKRYLKLKLQVSNATNGTHEFIDLVPCNKTKVEEVFNLALGEDHFICPENLFYEEPPAEAMSNGSMNASAGASTDASTDVSADAAASTSDHASTSSEADLEANTQAQERNLTLTELAQQPNITLDLIYQQCDEGCAYNKQYIEEYFQSKIVVTYLVSSDMVVANESLQMQTTKREASRLTLSLASRSQQTIEITENRFEDDMGQLVQFLSLTSLQATQSLAKLRRFQKLMFHQHFEFGEFGIFHKISTLKTPPIQGYSGRTESLETQMPAAENSTASAEPDEQPQNETETEPTISEETSEPVVPPSSVDDQYQDSPSRELSEASSSSDSKSQTGELGFMMKLGAGGGLVFLFYSLIKAIVAPISEHSFNMKLLKKLYFARYEGDEDLFETKPGKPTYEGEIDGKLEALFASKKRSQVSLRLNNYAVANGEQPPSQDERSFDDFEGGLDYQGWENEDPYTPSGGGQGGFAFSAMSNSNTNGPFQSKSKSPLDLKPDMKSSSPQTPGVFSANTNENVTLGKPREGEEPTPAGPPKTYRHFEGLQNSVLMEEMERHKIIRVTDGHWINLLLTWGKEKPGHLLSKMYVQGLRMIEQELSIENFIRRVRENTMLLEAQTPSSERRRLMAHHTQKSVIDFDPKSRRVAGTIQQMNPHEHCSSLSMLERYELEQEHNIQAKVLFKHDIRQAARPVRSDRADRIKEWVQRRMLREAQTLTISAFVGLAEHWMHCKQDQRRKLGRKAWGARGPVQVAVDQSRSSPTRNHQTPMKSPQQQIGTYRSGKETMRSYESEENQIVSERAGGRRPEVADLELQQATPMDPRFRR